MKILRGYIQCFFDIAGQAPHNSFYNDRQTHTWHITHSPTLTNALQQFTVTWSVAGSGDLRDDNGTGTVRTANWYRISTPEKVTMQARLSGNMIIVSASTSPLAPDTIQLFQQQTINGQPQTPTATNLPANPIAWPTIQWDSGHASPFDHRIEEKTRSGAFGPQQPGYAKMGELSWRIYFTFG